MEKHLDAIYRNRYEEFYLEDGTVFDSRATNWRDVPWDRVKRIVAHLDGHRHEFTDDHPGFVGFMNFRWGGSVAQYDAERKYTGHKKIDVWTVGWTDGERHYLTDIDFHSGEKIKEHEAPYGVFANHVHPLISGEKTYG